MGEIISDFFKAIQEEDKCLTVNIKQCRLRGFFKDENSSIIGFVYMPYCYDWCYPEHHRSQHQRCDPGHGECNR